MLDLIKEGIKLNQSLALLPLKALRRLVDDRNTTAKQAIDVAEDIVSTPFVAAARAIENNTARCPAKTVKTTECKVSGGPTVKNIWVNPEVTVFSDVETKPGERKAVLTVTGLLCDG